MVWALIAVLGVALGCGFRWPAMMALGTFVLVASLIAEAAQGTSPGMAILLSFLRLALLEAGYLAALLVRAGSSGRG